MKIYFPAGEQSHIAVFDEALSLEACSRIVNFVNNNATQVLTEGKTAGGVMPMTKRSFDLPMTDEALNKRFNYYPDYLKNAEITIAENLHLCISIYEQKYSEVHHPHGWVDTGFNFQLYEKGKGYYRRHIDNDGIHENDRVLAVIMYLNTVADGGGTDFPLHNTVVEAVVGRICIFPAIWTHPHIGVMPISENKNIISTFLKIGVNQNAI